MMEFAMHASRSRTLSPLVGESWRGLCCAKLSEGGASTPLPTFPHKGGGISGAYL
jgi:hypothetical protein